MSSFSFRAKLTRALLVVSWSSSSVTGPCYLSDPEDDLWHLWLSLSNRAKSAVAVMSPFAFQREATSRHTLLPYGRCILVNQPRCLLFITRGIVEDRVAHFKRFNDCFLLGVGVLGDLPINDNQRVLLIPESSPVLSSKTCIARWLSGIVGVGYAFLLIQYVLRYIKTDAMYWNTRRFQLFLTHLHL